MEVEFSDVFKKLTGMKKEGQAIKEQYLLIIG